MHIRADQLCYRLARFKEAFADHLTVPLVVIEVRALGQDLVRLKNRTRNGTVLHHV